MDFFNLSSKGENFTVEFNSLLFSNFFSCCCCCNLGKSFAFGASLGPCTGALRPTGSWLVFAQWVGLSSWGRAGSAVPGSVPAGHVQRSHTGLHLQRPPEGTRSHLQHSEPGATRIWIRLKLPLRCPGTATDRSCASNAAQSPARMEDIECLH